MAVFPLDLLNENRELHVIFRESIRITDEANNYLYYCNKLRLEP